MDIKIPFKWIKEYIELNCTAKEFAEKLSLTGPSIEKYKYNELIDDEVLEIEVTSNRVDMASVVGLAREASAVFGRKVNIPEFTIPALKLDDKLPVEVKVLETELCSRFTGIVIKGIEVKESPLWLKNRLLAIGLNSINNIVDITNYVMVEYGQPVHAYDYDLISDHKIIVRKSNNESIKVLGGKEFKMSNEVLVIADNNSPIGIAGIKGGAKCEITSNTKNVFIEVGNFNAELIRKISTKVLDLRTDASNFFEKGLSPVLAIITLKRVVELILKEAGGVVASEIIDIKNFDETQKRVNMNHSLVKKTLGVDISIPEIQTILLALGFEVNVTDELLNITVPYYREKDIEFDYDIVEEIARIYGYEKIPNILPATSIPVYQFGNDLKFEDDIRDVLSGAGFIELFTYSMIGERELKSAFLTEDDVIKIDNPISADFIFLRRELGSTTLKAYAENETREEELAFFEISNIYLPVSSGDLPKEQSTLVIAFNNRTPEKAFLKVKGAVELLAKKLGIEENLLKFLPAQLTPFYQKGSSAKIEGIGEIGLASNESLNTAGVKIPVAVAQINVASLLALKNSSQKKFKPIPEFPVAVRDLAFFINASTIWDEVKTEVIQLSGELFNSIELFDIYTGKGVPEGKKGIAFHLSLYSPAKTLTDSEVDLVISEITQKLSKEFGAVLRS